MCQSFQMRHERGALVPTRGCARARVEVEQAWPAVCARLGAFSAESVRALVGLRSVARRGGDDSSCACHKGESLSSHALAGGDQAFVVVLFCGTTWPHDGAAGSAFVVSSLGAELITTTGAVQRVSGRVVRIGLLPVLLLYKSVVVARVRLVQPWFVLEGPASRWFVSPSVYRCDRLCVVDRIPDVVVGPRVKRVAGDSSDCCGNAI
jgi:hypothetical protein